MQRLLIHGSFKPNASITRAEFATIASRFENYAKGNKTFTDVPATHWAQGYIASAYENNLISGYPDGSFKPENAITRAEVVKIVNSLLERAADKAYVDAAADLVKFNDLTSSHWAYYDIVEATNAHNYVKDENGVETWGVKEETTVEDNTSADATDDNTDENTSAEATVENAGN